MIEYESYDKHIVAVNKDLLEKGVTSICRTFDFKQGADYSEYVLKCRTAYTKREVFMMGGKLLKISELEYGMDWSFGAFVVKVHFKDFTEEELTKMTLKYLETVKYYTGFVNDLDNLNGEKNE